jgi:dodecin
VARIDLAEHGSQVRRWFVHRKADARIWGALARRECDMGDRVYKKIELVGTSTSGIEDAIQNAITTAAQTVKHMDWFEVSEMRGHIENGRVDHYQVVLKVGFRIER